MGLRFVLKKLLTTPPPPSVMFFRPAATHKVGVYDTKLGLFSSNLRQSNGGGFVGSFKKGLIQNNSTNNKEEEVFDKGFISHYSVADCISLVEVGRMRQKELNDRFLTVLYSFIDTINPLSPTRRFTRYLNWVENSYSFSPWSSNVWDVKETTEDVCLLRKMPPAGDDVEVSVQKHTPSSHKPIHLDKRYNPVFEMFGYVRFFRRMLIPSADLLIDVKGSQDNSNVKRPFAIKIGLPGKIYKTSRIKIDKNNDLLKVVIPKAQVDRVHHFDFLFLRR